MPTKISAGLLMYRRVAGGVELLLAHPGGPLWQHRDEASWTIPKGEAHEGEDLLVAARREFAEETGLEAVGPFVALGEVRMKSGKRVHAWACQAVAGWEPSQLRSNLFSMEWPPNSGQRGEFPEIDRAEFFTPEQARAKILPAQAPLIDALLAIL